MKNNILMIAYTNYSTDPRVIREAEALSEHYNVDFLALRKEDDPVGEEINGVHIIHLNQQRYRGNSSFKYILSYFEFFFRIFFYSIKTWKKYSLVHVNNMPDFIVFATFLYKLSGAKLILDIHDPMTTTYRTKFGLSDKSLLYKIILLEEKLSAWFVDQVITVHEPIKKDILVQEDGLPERKIEVIANFADGDIFRFNNAYGIDDTLKIVFHGTIAERFGLADVIDELSDIREADFELTIIGEGDYSDELKSVIKKFDMKNKVKFINKFFPVKELPKILGEYNLGLVSYKISEATQYMLPLKFLEYFSMGIPALCVKNKAISYYFDEKDAFFFNLEEKGSLKKIILMLLNQKNLLVEKREIISAKRENFLWYKEAQKYRNIVKNLLGKNNE